MLDINQPLRHGCYNLPMRLWSYTIAADQRDPDRPGFVWAPSAQIALAVIGHPDANVYELPRDAYCAPQEALNPGARPH